MEYHFSEIEKKWQAHWQATKAYKVDNNSTKPKYYVLDMFPYPSGAGLHVGHPLGYIASDIFARYKRLKGFNVLHPMGYDSFGLPAEQYALETGQHPAVTTEKNIATFRSQLDKIGFCFDWDREVRTSDPTYYKWTQQIFLQLFDSWFDRSANKAKNIAELIAIFEKEGNANCVCPGDKQIRFDATAWKAFSEKEQQELLMQYRLAFSAFGEVNWCEALGTVLANDEVINGFSERGGHPVVKKKMRQWYLRITEYADRLLQGLETVDFSDAMKEMQRNWIGKSQGAEIQFAIKAQTEPLVVYTTRPDTIFGVDFMVLAPEHALVEKITTTEKREAIEKYLTYVKSRSERERMSEVKQITGCFTGAYAINPFDGREIPIWIAEYVLAGYGTGAIMAVPCGDQRDYGFAKHFSIPITNIIGAHYNGEEANPTKEAILENSGFLNGLLMKDAIAVAIDKLEELKIGKRQVNYRMRDAGFSRQRYWGEPFPIVWEDGMAMPLKSDVLPLLLPHVDKYGPGPEGEGPLANIEDWVKAKYETSTMPGYAGSSWYFLRYMDPQNQNTFCDRKASDYWNQVDLYVGGTEHAVGHLLYSRMWTKVLCDLGHIGFDEPFKKLLNQGMIQGVSELMYRYKSLEQEENKHVSWEELPIGIKDQAGNISNHIVSEDGFKQVFYSADFVQKNNIDINQLSPIHVPVKFVNNSELSINDFINEHDIFQYDAFVVDGKYWHDYKWYDGQGKETSKGDFKTFSQVEKMSKRYMNVINPNDLCDRFGADTFRMYEMFLGPVEQSKPWDTKGIEGVHRFLRKLWRLFFDDIKGKVWNEDKATDAELKVLHRTIRKIDEDTEKFSYNTAVSAFMVCVNELQDLKCHKKEVLQHVLVLLTPYAPHIAEELWSAMGNTDSILDARYPVFEEKYVTETSKAYPIAINGKPRAEINIALDATQEQVEALVLADATVQKWLEGKTPKKIIYVRNKMVNIVP